MEINISNCTLSYLPQYSQLLNNSACFCKYTAGIQKLTLSSWSTALLENHLVFKLFTGLLEYTLNSLNIFFFPSKGKKYSFKYSKKKSFKRIFLQIFSILAGLFTYLCNSQFWRVTPKPLVFKGPVQRNKIASKEIDLFVFWMVVFKQQYFHISFIEQRNLCPNRSWVPASIMP